MTDANGWQQVRFGPCLTCGKAAFSCVCVPRPDANGWPDPKDSGAYVLRRRDGHEFLAWWSGPIGHWTLRGGAMMKASALVEIGTTVVGPCLTPAEHSAALAALAPYHSATLAGLREKKLVAVPRVPTEAIIDAMAEAHADAFACARASGALGLAPAQWLPLVWNAMLAAVSAAAADPAP